MPSSNYIAKMRCCNVVILVRDCLGLLGQPEDLMPHTSYTQSIASTYFSYPEHCLHIFLIPRGLATTYFSYPEHCHHFLVCCCSSGAWYTPRTELESTPPHFPTPCKAYHQHARIFTPPHLPRPQGITSLSLVVLLLLNCLVALAGGVLYRQHACVFTPPHLPRPQGITSLSLVVLLLLNCLVALAGGVLYHRWHWLINGMFTWVYAADQLALGALFDGRGAAGSIYTRR